MVELAVQGLAGKEIAVRLYVTVRTGEPHLSKICAKLGVRSRVELMARPKRLRDSTIARRRAHAVASAG